MQKSMLTVGMMMLISYASCNDEPPYIGMSNPASVYCEEIGGTLEIEKSPAGENGYCILPSGERIDEWVLFRRDNF
ncbi:putative hemolysin [Pantoea dispersa]|uniref:putative hemolysin n=1 Tax=Pantoea TaxID=53335 RepID=UPI00234FDD9B|nr:DUF333 domain-containing protein [Pantoea ananatis]MDC7862193.1 hemolysin [Pantoea ananatis]